MVEFPANYGSLPECIDWHKATNKNIYVRSTDKISFPGHEFLGWGCSHYPTLDWYPLNSFNYIQTFPNKNAQKIIHQGVFETLKTIKSL